MELDLDLDHLLLVLAANKAVEVSDEVVFLEEGVGAVLALIGDEVFVMNLNMLLHVVELSELFVAACALQNLVVATSRDSPHYTQGFSTDCHSNQISTVNKRTE